MTVMNVDANGLQMRVVEEGVGQPVLLLHGFPETSHSWRHQLKGLAEAGYRAIAPDLRGYGGTECPAEQEVYSAFDIVGDVIGLLDAMGIEKAVLVGNDWGSTVAWLAATLRPDRVRGVVAIGVPYMKPGPMPPSQFFPENDEALFYTLYFEQPGVAETEFEADIELTLRKILFSASYDAGPRQLGDGTPNPFAMVSRKHGLLGSLPETRVLPHWLSDADLQSYVAAFEASGFRGPLNYYRNLDANWRHQRAFAGRGVDVPANYLVGEQDVGLAIPGMREIIAGMVDTVPGLTRLMFIEKCGHWAPQEQPQKVTDALLAFLKELEGRASSI